MARACEWNLIFWKIQNKYFCSSYSNKTFYIKSLEYNLDCNPSSAIAAGAILNAGFASRSATPPLHIFPRAPIKYFRFFLINCLIASYWGRGRQVSINCICLHAWSMPITGTITISMQLYSLKSINWKSKVTCTCKYYSKILFLFLYSVKEILSIITIYGMRELWKSGLITSAWRLCNHLGLYVCVCVRMCVCMCVCVFVCQHDNSRNTKHIHTKFFECISHRLRKNWLKFGWVWLEIEREMNKILSCFSRTIKKNSLNA